MNSHGLDNANIMLDEVREISTICSMLVALDASRGANLKQLLPDKHIRRSLAELDIPALTRLAVVTRGIIQSGKMRSSTWWRRVINQMPTSAPTDYPAPDSAVIAAIFGDLASRIMVIRHAPDIPQPGLPDIETAQALAHMTRMEQMALACRIAQTHMVLPHDKSRNWWDHQMAEALADVVGPDEGSDQAIAATLRIACSCH